MKGTKNVNIYITYLKKNALPGPEPAQTPHPVASAPYLSPVRAPSGRTQPPGGEDRHPQRKGGLEDNVLLGKGDASRQQERYQAEPGQEQDPEEVLLEAGLQAEPEEEEEQERFRLGGSAPKQWKGPLAMQRRRGDQTRKLDGVLKKIGTLFFIIICGRSFNLT